MKTLHMLHSFELEVGSIVVTVRRGIKWANSQKGDELELCVCEGQPIQHNVVGKGIVQSAEIYRFCDLPWKVFYTEHEIAAKTYGGLLNSMKRAYGYDFNEKEIVTALFYKRIS